jgi:hypothetical protein
MQEVCDAVARLARVEECVWLGVLE